MNLVEIITIVVGACAGYWLVSFLFGGRKTPASAPPPAPAPMSDAPPPPPAAP